MGVSKPVTGDVLVDASPFRHFTADSPHRRLVQVPFFRLRKTGASDESLSRSFIKSSQTEWGISTVRFLPPLPNTVI